MPLGGRLSHTPVRQEGSLIHSFQTALLVLLGTYVGLGIPAQDVIAQSEEADSLTIERPRFPTTPT